MNDSATSKPSPLTRAAPAVGVLGGATLVALIAAMAWLSPRLAHGLNDRPITLYTALLFAAGAVFLAWLAALRSIHTDRRVLLGLILLGLLMRGAAWPSTPILESDYFRYLWDGAVTAEGRNPFEHPPTTDSLPAELTPLAERAGDVLPNVNHPTLRTIYPPVAQGAFSLAYHIDPFNPLAMRAVWLAFDALTALLIVLVLRELGRPRWWVAIWWANPLVVMQITNGLHMDVLPAMLVMLAVWCALRRWPIEAAGALGLAAGAKVWPALLLPLMLRGAGWRRGATGWVLFALIAGACAWPIAIAGLEDDSGLVAYTRHWHNNAGLYQLLHAGWFHLLQWTRALAIDPHGPARLTSAAVVAAIALGVAWRTPRDGAQRVGRALAVVAALFLLSPTQFPWYFVWVVPLLAVAPRWSLLVYAALWHGVAFAGVSTVDVLAVVAMGLLPGVVGHGLFNWAVRRLEVHVVSLAILLEPLGATTLAVLFLNRSVATVEAAGTLILLAGVGVGLPRARRRRA